MGDIFYEIKNLNEVRKDEYKLDFSINRWWVYPEIEELLSFKIESVEDAEKFIKLYHYYKSNTGEDISEIIQKLTEDGKMLTYSRWLLSTIEKILNEDCYGRVDNITNFVSITVQVENSNRDTKFKCDNKYIRNDMFIKSLKRLLTMKNKMLEEIYGN